MWLGLFANDIHFNPEQMKRLAQILILFLLSMLVATCVRAQSLDDILGGDDDDAPEATRSAPVGIHSEALILANGRPLQLKDELVITRATRYDVAISQLKPNSEIYVEFRKAGVKAGYKRFYANHRGEFMFEYLTPEMKAKGSALVRYTASNGRTVERECKVVLD